MKVGPQNGWLSLVGLLVVSGSLASAAELRTWTFSQDGQMCTSASGTLSFKKQGRLDAALIRLETNNVVLLAARAGNLSVAATNLSEADLIYVAKAKAIDKSGNACLEQSAMVKNEMSRRRREAAQLRNEAAAGRSSAQGEIEAAADLEIQAATLEASCGNLGIPVQPTDTDALNNSPDNRLEIRPRLNPTNHAAIAAGAADQLRQDITRLRQQAQAKRQHADKLQNHSASLEATAESEEANSAVWLEMVR